MAVWAAPVVAIAWALLADLLDRGQERTRAPVTPFLVFSAASIVLAGVVAWALNLAVKTGSEGTVLWVNILAGALCAVAGLILIGHIRGRQDAAGESEPGPWASSDSVIIALALPLLLGGYLMSKFTSRPDAWLSAAPLGCTVVVSLFALAARAQRLKTPGAALPLRMSAALELLAAAAAVVALGMLAGRLMRFDGQLVKNAGEVIGMQLAVSLLVWLALSVFQRALLSGSLAVSAAFFVVYSGLTAWLGALSAHAILPVSSVPGCFWVGLGSGVILVLMSTAGLFHRESGYARQAHAIALIVVVSALALCLRMLAGFGAAVCAGGILAAAPAWGLLTPWRARSSPEAGLAFPAPLVWSAGFLACMTALRIWLAVNDAVSVNVYLPYPFLGMVTGLALPFVLWSLSSGGNEDAVAPGGTGLALFGAVVAWLVAIGAIAAVAVVLREPAVRLFLFGLAGSTLAGLAVAGALREEWTSAPVVSTALFASLLTLTGAGAISAISAEAGRIEKVRALAIIFGVLIVFYLALEVWRTLVIRQRTTAIIVEET